MFVLIFYGVLCFWCVASGLRAPIYAEVKLSNKGNADKHGDIRESIASMKSDIESLKHRKKRVSMVACLKGSFTDSGAGSVLQILDIQTIYGITPSSQYRNGIFTCKDRGLYMVFATVTSIKTSFKLMRNKTSVSRGFIGGYSGHWSSGSSIAFVQLDEKDQISIQADKQMTIGDHSCFGVIKID